MLYTCRGRRAAGEREIESLKPCSGDTRPSLKMMFKLDRVPPIWIYDICYLTLKLKPC